MSMSRIAALDEHLRLRHRRWQNVEDEWVAWVDAAQLRSCDGRIVPQMCHASKLPADARLFRANDILLDPDVTAFLHGALGIVDLQARLLLAHDAPALPAYGACSRDLLVLHSISHEFDPHYLMHWLRHHGRRMWRETHSTRLHLPRSALARCWLWQPARELQQILAGYLEMHLAQLARLGGEPLQRLAAADAFAASAWLAWDTDWMEEIR